MSDTRYYLTLAAWLLVAIALFVGAYVLIKRADDREDKELARQVEADAEWDEWCASLAEKNQKGNVYDLPRGKEKDYQSRARRAEGLGFRDDPPKRSA